MGFVFMPVSRGDVKDIFMLIKFDQFPERKSFDICLDFIETAVM